ncbi:hypothetical protein GCM10027613_23820 [Microlunatus endophyticus]
MRLVGIGEPQPVTGLFDRGTLGARRQLDRRIDDHQDGFGHAAIESRSGRVVSIGPGDRVHRDQGLTVMVTPAADDVLIPLPTVKVNLSLPWKFLFGV